MWKKYYFEKKINKKNLLKGKFFSKPSLLKGKIFSKPSLLKGKILNKTFHDGQYKISKR